jgi:hypothetical protein
MVDQVSNGKLRSVTPVFLVGDIASTMRWYQDNLAFHAEPPTPDFVRRYRLIAALLSAHFVLVPPMIEELLLLNLRAG